MLLPWKQFQDNPSVSYPGCAGGLVDPALRAGGPEILYKRQSIML